VLHLRAQSSRLLHHTLPLDACDFNNNQILGVMIFTSSDALGPLLGSDDPGRLSLAALSHDRHHSTSQTLVTNTVPRL
jgi:hypothetical protein